LNNVFEKLLKINFEKLTRKELERIYLSQFNETEQKQLGQIYTPNYIIRFILHQIDFLAGFNFNAANLDLKVLDPACGLGSFLIESYELLKEKMRSLDLKEEEIHEILLNKILHGVDIEPIAAGITALALALRKKNQPIRQLNIAQFDILNPEENRSRNLRWINLQEILPDFFGKTNGSEDSQAPLENFNVIIGNPPYFLITQKERRVIRGRGKQFHTTFLPRNLVETYKSYYKSWPKHCKDQNIFYFFIERSIQLLREGGFLGFIIPDILLAGDSTENLRKVILESACIKKIMVIKGRVFENRGISNIIIILQRCSDAKIREQNKMEIIFTSTHELSENDSQGIYNKFKIVPHCIPQSIFQATPQNNFAIRINDTNLAIFQRIFRMLKGKKLVKLGDIVEIQRGIENLKRKDAISAKKTLQSTYQKLISASNIERYRIKWDAIPFMKKFVDYDPQNPKYQHINFKQQEWFMQPKIILKRVCDKLIAALDAPSEDEGAYYFAMDSVQMIWVKNEFREKYDLRVILAILNSKFMNFYYQTLFSYKQLFSRVQKVFLMQLPIPAEIPSEKKGEICKLVDDLIKSFDETTDASLNQLISILYFTPEELKLFRF